MGMRMIIELCLLFFLLILSSHPLLLHFVNAVELVLDTPLHIEVGGYLLREITATAYDEYLIN